MYAYSIIHPFSAGHLGSGITLLLHSLYELVTLPDGYSGSSSSAATSLVKWAWHPFAGWTAWLATFLACLALWRSRTLCFSFTLMRCNMTIPMRSVCPCHYPKLSLELNRKLLLPLVWTLIMVGIWHHCLCQLLRCIFFYYLGTGGSSGCCASVVNSQDAFYQLYLYTLQVRWRRAKPDDLWHWDFQ